MSCRHEETIARLRIALEQIAERLEQPRGLTALDVLNVAEMARAALAALES
jgi:hypothetical protein